MSQQDSEPLRREVVRRESPDIKMIPPSDDSPMKEFEKTWTDRERADELKDWSRERVGEYIQALTKSIRRMFSSIEDASCKSLTSLCLDMRAEGLDSLVFSARFKGSKFMIESERFSGKIELIKTASSAGGSGEESVSTLREGGEGSSSEKVAALWDDPAGGLELYDQLRVAFGDSDGTKTAARVAFLTLHLELISLRGATESSVALEGLTEGKGGDPSQGELGARVACSIEDRAIRAHPQARPRM